MASGPPALHALRARAARHRRGSSRGSAMRNLAIVSCLLGVHRRRVPAGDLRRLRRKRQSLPHSRGVPHPLSGHARRAPVPGRTRRGPHLSRLRAWRRLHAFRPRVREDLRGGGRLRIERLPVLRRLLPSGLLHLPGERAMQRAPRPARLDGIPRHHASSRGRHAGRSPPPKPWRFPHRGRPLSSRSPRARWWRQPSVWRRGRSEAGRRSCARSP